ncbi:hypothetical protein PEC18_06455 [Paucibacter sp. O1-1]|nr:hypothetical protein [Paucibacter sp. O1-1]MDA3825511.1 hypothetical protein [Paucibacter sp. O1-1]
MPYSRRSTVAQRSYWASASLRRPSVAQVCISSRCASSLPGSSSSQRCRQGAAASWRPAASSVRASRSSAAQARRSTRVRSPLSQVSNPSLMRAPPCSSGPA